MVGRGDDLWSHSYERDCGPTHQSSAHFIFMLKNLVIFSTCLPIIDILYLYLLKSNRLIASNFHIVYHIILHSRPVPNYRKSAMNRLWSIIDRLAVTDYRLWNYNRFPTLGIGSILLVVCILYHTWDTQKSMKPLFGHPVSKYRLRPCCQVYPSHLHQSQKVSLFNTSLTLTDSDVHTLIFKFFCYWLYGMNIDTRPYTLQC